MEIAKLKPEDIIATYKKDIESLIKYIEWFDEQKDVYEETYYKQDNLPQNMRIPTYSSTLLAFIKAVQKTKLIDRNYRYAYSRNHIRSVEDELVYIKNAKLENINVLMAIISSYVLRGMTKGKVWNDGVMNCVFLECLIKLKSIIEPPENILDEIRNSI